MFTLFWKGKKFPMDLINLRPTDENAVMGTVKHGGWGFGFTRKGVQYFYPIVGATCMIDGFHHYAISAGWGHVSSFCHLMHVLTVRDKR